MEALLRKKFSSQSERGSQLADLRRRYADGSQSCCLEEQRHTCSKTSLSPCLKNTPSLSLLLSLDVTNLLIYQPDGEVSRSRDCAQSQSDVSLHSMCL